MARGLTRWQVQARHGKSPYERFDSLALRDELGGEFRQQPAHRKSYNMIGYDIPTTVYAGTENGMVDGAHHRWLLELGARLRTARLNANLTQQQPAERLGISPQLVSHRELARAEPSSHDILLFIQITGADPAWLLTGRAPPAPKTSEGSGYVAPLASVREIITMAATFEQDPSADWEFRFADLGRRTVPIRSQLSARAFALEMPDRALEPEIPAGDIVVADADVKPEPGDLGVFVLVASGETLIRRLANPMAKGTFVLKANNALFEKRTITPAHHPWGCRVAETSRTYERAGKTKKPLAAKLSAK